MKRQITSLAVTPTGRVFAACDDGTLWALSAGSEQWQKLPSIPQPSPSVREVTLPSGRTVRTTQGEEP